MITQAKITEDKMKVTYHIGDKKITYNTAAVPQEGNTVEIESGDQGEFDNMVFIVKHVKFKLFSDFPNVFEEADVYLALDATITINTALLDTIYTSTTMR